MKNKVIRLLVLVNMVMLIGCSSVENETKSDIGISSSEDSISINSNDEIKDDDETLSDNAISNNQSEENSTDNIEISFNELEQKTIDSLTTVKEGIYVLDCYSDYKVDEYLKANISDVDKFDEWMAENLTYGVSTSDKTKMGCSSFSVNGPMGSHLFGRNYELDGGDSMIVRIYPKDGYASIGIADLNHLNLTHVDHGSKGDYNINNDESKPLLLAAPWCVCDGINEKGLGVSLLSLFDEHEVNDTDKDNLLIYSALRVVLDKCASVDEAVDLLNNYDMYSPSRHSYHMFITDKSGKSVTVEWAEGQTFVMEDTAVANFWLYKERISLDGDQRYTKLHNGIDNVEFMTKEEAMDLLKLVTRGNRWSAVYDLDNFSVDICFNNDFENIYSY